MARWIAVAVIATIIWIAFFCADRKAALPDSIILAGLVAIFGSACILAIAVSAIVIAGF